MQTSITNRRIFSTERLILRALIAHPPGGPQWKSAFSRLAGYTWHDHDHQIVFESLRELRGRYPELLREWLAASVTRKGFPDFDLDPYFVPATLSPSQLLRRIQTLLSC